MFPVGMTVYYLAWKYLVGFLNEEIGIARVSRQTAVGTWQVRQSTMRKMGYRAEVAARLPPVNPPHVTARCRLPAAC